MEAFMLARFFGLSLVALFLCGCALFAPSERPIKVLVVDGYSNHDWRHTTRCIKEILSRAGGFDVTVSTYPYGDEKAIRKWNPDFSAYDVVVQNMNAKKPWPVPARKSLERYVRNGGGLYIFHSANNAFSGWGEYNKMIGLGWRRRDFGWALTVSDDGKVNRIPAGKGGNTGHGRRVDALVTRIGDHPIYRGFPRRWRAADIEIYRYARGPAENLQVLSYAKEPKTKLNFPVEWIARYGKGEVYNSTFGHVWKDQKNPKGVRCAGFQTVFVRALRYLAGRDVGGKLPDDFPTADKVSLRSYPE